MDWFEKYVQTKSHACRFIHSHEHSMAVAFHRHTHTTHINMHKHTHTDRHTCQNASPGTLVAPYAAASFENTQTHTHISCTPCPHKVLGGRSQVIT